MTTREEFDVIANDKASSKLDKIGRAFGRLGSGAKDAGKHAGGLAGKVGGLLGGALKGGAIGVGILAAGLVGLAPTVISSAANLELMGKKAATVFGSELPKVQAWAGKAAHGMGLTKSEAVGLAAGFSDLLVPMGFARDRAAQMSTQAIGLSGALSEWSGGQLSAADAAGVLSAAMLGERDGLQAVGISISQAQVDTQVLANKKKGLKFATQEQAEAQATLDLIMAKSTDAQAAYANGSGTLARKVAVTKARFKEMGEGLLLTALPALKKLADITLQQVMPAMEKFGGWVSENGETIGLAFIAMFEMLLKGVQFSTPALKLVIQLVTAMFSTILRGAAKAADALGMEGTAEKLRGAADGIEAFGDTADLAFDAAIKKAGEWDRALDKTKTELKLKADIKDWEKNLKTALDAVKNPNLTKERRAQLRATITDLENKIRTAKEQLGSRDLIRERRANLRATITDLDNKIKSAKEKLADPKLTATKRAQLSANIGALQRQVNAAKAKLNELRDKTVTIRTVTVGGKVQDQGVGRGGHTAVERAHGGPLRAGQLAVVGEQGPELFVPDRDGRIIPNGGAPRPAAGATGAGQPIVFNFPPMTPAPFISWLKEAVRGQGGNVSVVLGTGRA